MELPHRGAMKLSQALPRALGALAVAGGIAMTVFNLIFAVTLSKDTLVTKANVPAIAASVLDPVTVGLLIVLLVRQIQHPNGDHFHDSKRGRQTTYVLAAFAALFAILSAAATAVVLGLMINAFAVLPKVTVGLSTRSLMVGAFVVWSISLLSQAVFLICMVVVQRADFPHKRQRSFRSESPSQPSSEMQKAERPPVESFRESMGYRGHMSVESMSPPPSSDGRFRAESEPISSIRNSLSQVVRPINSKTKLISHNHRPSYTPSSVDSGSRDIRISMDEGFDSWDFSALDAQSRQAVESASPTPPRFLETIPASPAVSRSPSPGHPLDLEPPKKTHPRSPSYSPASSFKDAPRAMRSTTSTESIREAHIHPLFRTDSATPPPTATPGTIVTAAPGAGQVIPDRKSIRPIIRSRSGSLAASPLQHSESMDSVRQIIERDDRETPEDCGIERTLTPPIPEWILSAGTRTNSMPAHYSRKKCQTGLGLSADVAGGMI